MTEQRKNWPIPESQYVTSVPLRVGVRDGVIVDVGPYRHRVIWDGETESSVVDYCNNCGGVFLRRGRLKPEADPLRRWVYACAECHVFQGFMSEDESGENLNTNAQFPAPETP